MIQPSSLMTAQASPPSLSSSSIKTPLHSAPASKLDWQLTYRTTLPITEHTSRKAKTMPDLPRGRPICIWPYKILPGPEKGEGGKRDICPCCQWQQWWGNCLITFFESSLAQSIDRVWFNIWTSYILMPFWDTVWDYIVSSVRCFSGLFIFSFPCPNTLKVLHLRVTIRIMSKEKKWSHYGNNDKVRHVLPNHFLICLLLSIPNTQHF